MSVSFDRRGLGLLRLLKAPGAFDNHFTVSTQQQPQPRPAASNTIREAPEDAWRESLGSPDSVSCCSCPHCVHNGCGADRKSPCSTASSLDWELELGDEQPALDARSPHASQLHSQQHEQQQRMQVQQAQVEQRRRPVLPCLQLPCLQPTSSSNCGDSSSQISSRNSHPDSKATDCSSSPDVQCSAGKMPAVGLRLHRNSDGSVQQRPQPPLQVDSRWGGEADAAAACQRIHSSPAPCARDPSDVFGQHSAPLPAPLLAPPPAFQLASFAATAAAVGCVVSEPLAQLAQHSPAVSNSSAAGSPSTGQVAAQRPARGAVEASAAEPCSFGPTQLLVVSPLLPAGMQRTQWSLSDFWISKRLYRGYASSVYHVSGTWQHAVIMSCRWLALQCSMLAVEGYHH